jgi:hypothetical protein
MRRKRIQITNLDTGIVEEEVYRLNGKRHRDPKEGPAFITRGDDGEPDWEEYWAHGRLHRVDGPAVIFHAMEAVEEEYYRRGVLHRNPSEGPAEVHTDWRTGHVVREVYEVRGRRHRPPSEGPALILRDATTGVITEAEYCLYGRRSRLPDEGPAFIARDATTGVITREEYWLNGSRHRPPTEGPAVILRDAATGAITATEYYIVDKQVPGPERPTGSPLRGPRKEPCP